MRINAIPNYQRYYKNAQYNNFATNTSQIAFSGVEDRFDKLAGESDEQLEREKRKTANISRLFNSDINISEKEAQFLEDYLSEEQKIKDEYDTKIAKIEDADLSAELVCNRYHDVTNKVRRTPLQ